MGRYLAIDYGKKRTGIAVTDPLKIIANGLATVPTQELIAYLTTYFKTEEVELIVLGLPKDLKSQDTDATQGAQDLKITLEKHFPDIPVHFIDERFTSKMAKASMITGGMSKKNRRKKENVDIISATIILQSFMEANPPARL